MSIEIANYRPEVVGADIRPHPRSPESSGAALQRQRMKLDDLLAAIDAHGNVGTLSNDRIGRDNGVEPESLVSVRTKGSFVRCVMRHPIANGAKTVRIELNRLRKPAASEGNMIKHPILQSRF